MRSTLGATRLPSENPIKGKDLTSAQLESVTEVFEVLGLSLIHI